MHLWSPQKLVNYLNGLGQAETINACYRILKNMPKDGELETYYNAFSVVVELVSLSEVALAEFLRLEGIGICLQYLKCEDGILRKSTCELIKESCQNNPPAQEAAFQANLLPALMELTANVGQRKQAMSAISAIVRGHDTALSDFIAKGGADFLKAGLRIDNPDVSIKFAFFIHTAFFDSEDLRSTLRNAGVVVCLLERLTVAVIENDDHLIEHLLGALVIIVENDNKALEDCAEPANGLRENLRACQIIFPYMVSSPEAHGFMNTLITVVFNGVLPS